MLGRTLLCASLLTTLAAFPAGARAADDVPPRRDPAATANDGLFLPDTLGARIGDQRVAALLLAGYDSAPTTSLFNAGVLMRAMVEGALYRRVALRVGMDWNGNGPGVAAAVGVKAALLDQERFGLDLALDATWRSVGFMEPGGEVELAVLVARRFGRLGLYGNLGYAQGINLAERHGFARLALLYAVGERAQIGWDDRLNLDLGSTVTEAIREGQPEADLDLVAGPTASVAVGPIAFVAQAGLHLAYYETKTLTAGVAALGGIGSSF